MTIITTRTGHKIDLALWLNVAFPAFDGELPKGPETRSYFGTIKIVDGVICIFDYETASEYWFAPHSISEIRVGPEIEAGQNGWVKP